MQEEVREKSVTLTIKVGKTSGKLTTDLLKWVICRYLDQSHISTMAGSLSGRGTKH